MERLNITINQATTQATTLLKLWLFHNSIPLKSIPPAQYYNTADNRNDDEERNLSFCLTFGNKEQMRRWRKPCAVFYRSHGRASGI